MRSYCRLAPALRVESQQDGVALRMYRIKRGLDLPIAGEPEQTISDGPAIRTVGLVAADYIGMRPTMEVNEGDRVRLGQTLFLDKKTPGVRYVSPGSGTVTAVNRGAKRAFLSISVELDGGDEEQFESYYDSDLTALPRNEVRDNLVNSGLWTSLRTRPFGKVPQLDAVPHSIFVTAMDTNPLAARPEPIIAEREREFYYGLQALRRLTDGPLYVCKWPGEQLTRSSLDFCRVEEFYGPHPAGLPGTHIHFLDPVSRNRTVWYLNYQDVIAIGRLFLTGRLLTERIISLAGPAVKSPRLIRTRVGASLAELVENELEPGDNRVISGSVLSGRSVSGIGSEFLGRYALQVSALPEGRERVFLGWQAPGFHKFSVKRVFASAFIRPGTRRFSMTTSKEGSARAMVPIEMYEQVVPLDMIPTYLLRSLIIGDLEQAQALGALELEEEDLALCTFVCPGKYEYGPLLRRSLTSIEREG